MHEVTNARHDGDANPEGAIIGDTLKFLRKQAFCSLLRDVVRDRDITTAVPMISQPGQAVTISVPMISQAGQAMFVHVHIFQTLDCLL